MTLALGAIADDYTGASDLANTLTKNGLRTVQTIGVPAPDLVLPDVDAVVVALKSRSAPVEEAVAKSLAAHRWLMANGARHVLFKVCSTFDSTDAGNIGQVMDALKEETGEKIVLVTPAFPETGRTVYQGNLFVAGVPLAESPMKDHPLNPMRDSDLRRVLSRQSTGDVGLVDLATVAGGVEAIESRLSDLSAAGIGAAIADAVFEDDLVTVGRSAAAMRLSVGASGLGLGLARAMAPEGRHGSAGAPFAAIGGLSACLAGSCSAATLAQVSAAEAFMPVLRLDAEALLSGNATIDEALAFADAHLADGPVLIVSSATPDKVKALQESHGGAAVGQAIEHAFAEIAAGLVLRGVRRLVVAGGETSGAVVDRLGLTAFELGPEIAPGVPVLKTIGGTDATRDMRLALKSGNFGQVDFFRDALGMMPGGLSPRRHEDETTGTAMSETMERGPRIGLVTGGGTGVGKAMTAALVAAGWTIVITGRRAEVLEATAAEIGGDAGRVVAIPADIGDPASVAMLFSEIVARLGRLDLLVNNAGTNVPPIPLEEVSFEQWNTIVAANLTGAFLCTQEAFRLFKAQTPRGGRIINNGSISATTPRPNSAPYTATKHAIAGLTKATALDGRPFDIACGQIDIGNAASDMTAKMSSGVLQANGTTASEATMDPAHVGAVVVQMAGLPLEVNVLTMTIMATQMPYVGRG